MGDPHRKDRYGELWPADRLAVQKHEILRLHGVCIFSGGWAWHFMSPPGHIEYKHAHDHKDIDAFVTPSLVPLLFERLEVLGYQRERTRFDHIRTGIPFYRFAHTVKDTKVILDLFVKDVPSIEVQGMRLVEPSTLLTFYDKGIQASDECFAVLAARKLLARGISPVGRRELCEIPEKGLAS